MIARTQHHLFQPLLYQVATGISSEGEIAPATRRIIRNQRNAEVLLGDVVEIKSGRTVRGRQAARAALPDRVRQPDRRSRRRPILFR
jgi:NADH dehydrogenase FAD-containing subunit